MSLVRILLSVCIFYQMCLMVVDAKPDGYQPWQHASDNEQDSLELLIRSVDRDYGVIKSRAARHLKDAEADLMVAEIEYVRELIKEKPEFLELLKTNDDQDESQVIPTADQPSPKSKHHHHHKRQRNFLI